MKWKITEKQSIQFRVYIQFKVFFPEGAEGCPRAWRERSLGAILCPGPVYPASALADNSPILRVVDYYLK